jgi:hypothetical protein
MNVFGVDGRWLLAESLRIGSIVLVGFLLAHFLTEAIGAFAIELLYGVQGTLVAVIRYTALLTALLYTITKGVDAASSKPGFE